VFAGKTAKDMFDLVSDPKRRAEAEEMIVAKLLVGERQSTEYWSRLRADCNVYFQHLGPPTWFVTLSVAEYEWEDVK
jgi:hypothetical protein